MAAISLALQAQAPRPRMVCLFLDLNSTDAADQTKARDNAIQFIEQQAAPSDLVEIMTYTTRANVIQDFTGDHDSLLAALRTISPNNAPSQAGSSAADLNTRLQAIQTAVSSLSRFPERKTLVYYSAVMPLPSRDDDDRSALKDAVTAALRANVTIYSPDLRGAPAPAR